MPRMRAATSTRTPWLARLAANPGSASGHAILSKSPSSSLGITAARGIDMVVPLRVLAVGEEALRNHEVQIVPGTRHRDIEEAPLLLDLGRGAGTEVRGNAAIDDVQDEDRFPFLALGRVNGRKDQIILVEQRHPGLVAGRV